MASSPPLLTPEDDDNPEFDVAGHEVVRAYRTGGKTSSPKGSEQEKGLFDRLSDRFQTKRQRKKIEELQTKTENLEDENLALKLQLQKEKLKKFDQEQKIHAIMIDCNNFQLGDGNILKILQYDPETEDPIPLLKEVLNITLKATDEIVQKLTISEDKQTKNSKTLQKINQMVLQLTESGSQTNGHFMEELKEVVELQSEYEKIDALENALKLLKVEGAKCFEDLNGDAKRSIRIIAYNFGSITNQHFAKVFGQTSESVGKELIDENPCALIILRWLEFRGNNVRKLLGILKRIEDKHLKDLMEDLKTQTFAKYSAAKIRESTKLSKTNDIAQSTFSLKSTRIDVSETLDMIDRHVHETLQKTVDSNDLKPDAETVLCAIYKLQVESRQTLRAINERTAATDEKLNTFTLDEEVSEINNGGDIKKEKRSEEFV